MKRNNTMIKNYLIAALLVCLWSMTSMAQSFCVGTDAPGGGSGGVTTKDLAQSLTMGSGCSGDFAGITIDAGGLTTDGGEVWTLRIYQGDGFGGTLRYTQNNIAITEEFAGYIFVEIGGGSGTTAFTPGAQYTFRLSTTSTTNSIAVFRNTTSFYGGGQGYIDGTALATNGDILDFNIFTQAATSSCGAATRLYVKHNASGSNNGTSWANAYTSLQSALDYASGCTNIQEIWVAAGTYKPSKDASGNASPSNAANKTFFIDFPIAIYGGFAGTNESMLSQRNVTSNVTILSGDIDNNDTASPATSPSNITGTNASLVVHVKNVSAGVILDGFTVTASQWTIGVVGGGFANDAVGFPFGCTTTVRQCRFMGHKDAAAATIRGNLGSNSSGNATGIFENCSFSGTSSSFGGGVFLDSNGGYTNCTFTDCLFSNNTSTSYGGGLADLAQSGDSDASFTRCEFRANSVTGRGGAVSILGQNVGHVNHSYTNCIFWGNEATVKGGALDIDATSSGQITTTITNCTFFDNTSPLGGALRYAASGAGGFANIPIINSIFWQNGDEIVRETGGNATLNYSLITTASLPSGVSGSNNIFNNDPLFVSAAAGNFQLQNCSPARNSGTASGAPSTDYVNATRPALGGYDMGAYEAQSGGGGTTTYYRDMDGDGFGDLNNTTVACTQPSGYVTNSTDCNDNNAAIKPGATEVCDGVDNDCDNQIDEGVGATTWYRDQDGDGFGNPSNTTTACTQPTGYVSNNTDCDDSDALEKPGQVWYDDTDSDGYGQTGAASITQCLRPTGYRAASELISTTGDCNDTNAAIKPGATEVCDGVDNNCNGSTDEGVQTTYYRDQDGDGFGNPAMTQMACSQPTGYVTNNTDCDDNDALEKPGQVWYDDTDSDGYGQTGAASITQCLRPTGYRAASELTSTTGDCNDANAAIKPGATETCNGIDDDCDSSIDEGAQLTYYRDQDGDGFGNPADSQIACTPPTGYVVNNTDCDDNDALEKPGQVWYDDTDNDGYGQTGAATITQCLRPTGYRAASELISTTGDCNDTNAAIKPGATEVCDSVDNDCDNSTDEGVQTTYYRDQDGDGFGNPAMTQMACSQPTGYVTNNTDCDDSDALEKPGQVWYDDTDNDGYGQTGAATITQCLRPTGYRAASELTSTTGDCNDANAAIKPGATETCNDIDDDCDSSIDEGTQIAYYRDQDGDGFGNPADSQIACTPPAGYVADNTDCNDNSALEKPGQVWYDDTDNDGYGQTGAATITQCLRPTGYKAASELTSTTGDCNDTNAAINPAATEVCDGIDNNCNGSTDEGVQTTYYRDQDNDGFGNPANSTQACSQPAGYVTNNTDCDDNDALEKPGQVWYKDTDNDGYGQTGAATTTQCLRPAGYKVASELTSTTGDCNDTNAAINPAATEICDGIDNNCNGSTDEGTQTTYYRDQDGDGFGNPAVTQIACAPPAGYVANNTDCNDNSALEKPGQVWYKDTDSDNYAETGAATITQCLRPTGYKAASELTSTTGDCNDTNAAINPAATEICNGIDDDCDNSIDEGTQTTYYRDQDGDGFGNPAVTQVACTPPAGYVANNTDCNDNSALEKPGQVWYDDTDSDGYGQTGAATITQCLRPTGYRAASELTSTTGDCNDASAAINPAATEVCDGVDNNCNGSTDEGVQTTYYRDQDNDGFGNPAVTQLACSQPAGYVLNNTDCNDNSAIEKPGQVWYKDTDNDGYSPGMTLTQCTRPAGYKVAAELTATSGDCNDNNGAISPAASEICDGIDNDCDNLTDEGVKTEYFADTDGDGYGDPNDMVTECSQPQGYVLNDDDCDDTDDNVYPGGEEVCDDKDNDCNGVTDDIGGSTAGNWNQGDVGTPGGSTNFPPCNAEPQDVFTLASTGYSTSSNDNVNMVYQTLCGNGEITARVLTISGGGWAGIMLRETLDPGAKKVSLKTQLGNNIRREIRATTNGAASMLNFVRPGHIWLRLTRSGSNFVGYTSVDGVTWSFAFSATVSMNGCIYAGLFSESINATVTTTATFDNVSISSSTLPLASASRPATALDGLQPEMQVDLYPNPTEGVVSLNFTELTTASEQQATIRVFDLTGKQVIEKQATVLNGTVEFIDLAQLPDGVYSLHIAAAGQAPVTKRVVLAKADGVMKK